MEKRLAVSDPGARLLVRQGKLSGVGEHQVLGCVGEGLSIVAPRTAKDRRHFVRVTAFKRGLLESVQVFHSDGSAASFLVAVFERISDGFAVWNAVFRSTTIVAVETEIPHYYAYPYGDPKYGEGYTEFDTKTVNAIEAIGLMAPFQNREVEEESEGAVYLLIMPTDTTTDNEFYFRLSFLALQ